MPLNDSIGPFKIDTERKLKLKLLVKDSNDFRSVSDYIRYLIDCGLKGRILDDEKAVLLKLGEMVGTDETMLQRHLKKKAQKAVEREKQVRPQRARP